MKRYGFFAALVILGLIFLSYQNYEGAAGAESAPVVIVNSDSPTTTIDGKLYYYAESPYSWTDISTATSLKDCGSSKETIEYSEIRYALLVNNEVFALPINLYMEIGVEDYDNPSCILGRKHTRVLKFSLPFAINVESEENIIAEGTTITRMYRLFRSARGSEDIISKPILNERYTLANGIIVELIHTYLTEGWDSLGPLDNDRRALSNYWHGFSITPKVYVPASMIETQDPGKILPIDDGQVTIPVEPPEEEPEPEPEPEPWFCGDGICDRNETIFNCLDDCTIAEDEGAGGESQEIDWLWVILPIGLVSGIILLAFYRRKKARN